MLHYFHTEYGSDVQPLKKALSTITTSKLAKLDFGLYGHNQIQKELEQLCCNIGIGFLSNFLHNFITG